MISGSGHAGRIYELGNDQPFTCADFAAVLTAAGGRQVTYQNLSAEAYTAALEQAGLPAAAVAARIVDADLGIARGELDTASGDLGRLIGRPTATAQQAVTAALQETSAHT